MALSLYDITIPVFIRSLKITSAFLAKAQAHAEEKGLDLSTLTEARLASDMHPLTRQIQIMSDSAKGAAVRLGGTEPVSFEDTEKTIDELQARITKTIELLETVDPKSMEGKEGAEIVVKAGPNEYKFTGKSFVLNFALPNFFFHETTTYAILRHTGVPLGKMDFLGGI